MTPDPTPEDSADRSRLPVDCAAHAAALESLLESSRTAKSPASTTPAAESYAAHRVNCVGCADAWRTALAVESVVTRWRAPDLPLGFRERALAAALSLGESRSCRLFLSRLEAWRAGDLPADAALAASAHRDACADCAAEAQIASQVDSLVRSVSAPFPSPSFRARILQLLGVAGPSGAKLDGRAKHDRSFVASPSRRPIRALRFAAAAGLLVTATFGFLTVSTDAPAVRGPAPPTSDGIVASPNPTTDRADLARTASNEARRGSVGTFASAPRHVERFARSGGNRLHKSIQRAILEGVAADPLPSNSGGTSR